MERKTYTTPSARHIDMQAEQGFLAGSTEYNWTRKMEASEDWGDDADQSGKNFWY